MIPWLLVAQLVSQQNKPLSSMVDACMAEFPASGEINRVVPDTNRAIKKVSDTYAAGALATDTMDGLSLEFPEWRFNLRASNTEPVIRLNVESRADVALMQSKTRDILSILDSMT
jgi:phosphomannomutase